MEFIDFLNKRTDNKYNFVKLTEVTFDGNKTCTCKFVYDGNIRDLNESDKSLFSDALKEFIGVDCEVVVKFKKESFDLDVLFQYISTFIQKMYPSAYASFKPKDLEILTEYEDITLKITILDVYYEYLKARNFESELKKYLSKFYFKTFEIKLVELNQNSNIEDVLNSQEISVQSLIDDINLESNVKTFKVLEVRKLIGEELESECRFFTSLRKPIENILTAGKIMQCYQGTFKSKTLKNEDGTPKEKVRYNFKLEQNGESIDCVYFPKDSDLANFQTLNIGDEIVVNGNIEEYNGRTNLKVKQVSLCKLPAFEEVKITYKKVNDKYKVVFPEPYEIKEQSDLFTFNDEEKVNNILANNTFVVYDFETTGFKYMEDDIIEIGAVKVVNGKIKETFDTFLKPTLHDKIPLEITKLTGITDEMVKDAPKICDVIPDFYKFCYGAVLVGHNVLDFDNFFLQKAGRDYKYNFNNKQLDTLQISRQYIKSVKNYKLHTIATALGVKLDNAHRAIYDTIATAEVFIKLTDYMENI